MSTTTLPAPGCRFGAPMGRVEMIPPPGALTEKTKLLKLRINSGGYDQAGAYWGIRPLGTSIYNCFTEDRALDVYVDADSRAQAIEKLRRRVPGITFARH